MSDFELQGKLVEKLGFLRLHDSLHEGRRTPNLTMTRDEDYIYTVAEAQLGGVEVRMWCGG